MVTSARQHELILDHLTLAKRLARRYRGRGVENDDLEQVARLALVKAADGFDEKRGAFAAFAKATISGELKRYFRDRAWGVRPPRRVQEMQAEISAELGGQDLSAGQVTDLAERLGVPPTDITEAAAARGCYAPDSLEAAEQDGHVIGCTDDCADFVDEWVTFHALCRDLTPRDRQLLHWRFVDDLTQLEIAAHLGISQMQVSRRISAVLSRLRTAAHDDAA